MCRLRMIINSREGTIKELFLWEKSIFTFASKQNGPCIIIFDFVKFAMPFNLYLSLLIYDLQSED